MEFDCENSVEAVVTMFGIAKAGLVAVPVNPNLAPDVLEWVVDHVGIRFTVVTVAPDREVDVDGILAFARQWLAGYEAPKKIAVLDRMPKTVGGKIMKYKLRELFARED